jgi:tetratricopeptide (TPR) repeat protein
VCSIDRVTNAAARDVARADELVDRALAAAPPSPGAHLAKGMVLRAQDRCAEAIPQYETVLAINPSAPAVLDALADCKLLTGSIDEVIPLAEQAIRLSPRDPELAIFT